MEEFTANNHPNPVKKRGSIGGTISGLKQRSPTCAGNFFSKALRLHGVVAELGIGIDQND